MKSMEQLSVTSLAPVSEGESRNRWISRLISPVRFLAGAALVTGLIASAVSVPVASASATKSVRLVLGGGTDFSDASLYYAINTLKHEGINVTLDNLADPASALEAVISGQSDIYLGDPMEAAVAVGNSGAAVQYLGTIDQTTDYVILALPQFTLKNLSGATLATAGPGTAGAIIANTALAKIGIDPTSLNDVTVGGTSARVTAILSGQVDLAPALAPSAVAAVATGKVKVLLNAGSVLGKYLQQGMIASDSFIHANSSLVQTVVNAFLDSNRWALANEAQFLSVANANQLGSGLTTQEEQISWQQFKSGNFFAPNGAICANAISSTENYTYAAGGSLTKSNTPAYKTWVNPKFVQAYLKAHKQPITAC